MDTLLIDVCDFPSLCMNEQFFHLFPDAQDITIEFEWEPLDEGGGGFFWQAFVNGVEIEGMFDNKDAKFIDEALVSYVEACYG
jgi:hypothetical protein